MIDSSALDVAFAALSHPTRRAILARLAQGEATVNELAAPFDMTLPAVSKHIRALENANLLIRRREAQRHICNLNPETIKAVAGWAELYRPIWEARFDRMDALLRHKQEDTT